MRLRTPLCSIPWWAYNGGEHSYDTFTPEMRTYPAIRCRYPNVGCDCRQSRDEIGNATQPFPLYYTIRQCSDTDIRVSLNLFYQKDGALWLIWDLGHDL